MSFPLTDLTTNEIVRSSPKQSFCLADVAAIADARPGRITAPYAHCDVNAYTNSIRMGVSVGFADVYDKDLAGQNFDVTAFMSLPPHMYRMTERVNPQGLLYSGPGGTSTTSFDVMLGIGVPYGTGVERPGI